MNIAEAQKILSRVAAQLSEHFDSVALIATYQTGGADGNTESGWAFEGNMYANESAVRECAKALQDEGGRRPHGDTDEEDDD